MARIRTIKPDFWQDEKMAPLAAIHRLVFLGLISQADDEGRLVDNVRLIDGLLFPQTDESSRESLDTLARLKRIVRYSGPSGQRLIQIVRWKDHQKVDNPGSRVLPPPPPELLAASLDSCPSGESREDIARVSPPEVGSRIRDVGGRKRENGASIHPPAVASFLAELPEGQSEEHWVAIINGWRNGMGFEGGKAATAADIDTGLTEYLAGAKRDFSVIHVRSFVERAYRARQKAEARGNGHSTEQAARVWELIKSRGIQHRTTQREIDIEVQALVDDGAITSAAAFKTVLKKLDFDTLRKAQTPAFAVKHISERMNGSTGKAL
jgi:hypothetical protein